MDGKVVIGTQIDTSGAEQDAEKLQKLLDAQFKREHRFDDFFDEFNDGAKEAEQNVEEIKKTLNEVSEVNLKKIGNSMKGMVKNVVKWGLAIFGIRGAYMAVRNAMSTITQQDEKLANDIQFIKTALAYTLEPVIRAIVNLMKTLATYVAYVVKAWTGRDIFASASKNLKAGAKSAKEINKSMAGFDEAQTLSSSKSSGGGGAGVPSMSLEDAEIPSWLQWIVDHKDEVIAGLAGIAGGLIAVNLGMSAIQGTGVGLAIAGIVYAIQNLINFINDPSFGNFMGILEGIALAVTGVAIAFGLWPVAIGGAIALGVAVLVKYYDKIVGFFDSITKWLEDNFLGTLRTLFGPVGDILYAPFEFFWNLTRGMFENLFGGIKQFIDGIIKLFKGDFKGGLKDIFGGIYKIIIAPFDSFWKAIKKLVERLWTAFKEIGTKVGDVIGGAFKKVINAVLGAIEKVLNFPIKAINKLIDVINDVPGIKIGKLSTFDLPRLAKGGIVNMPGRGVPVGGAIAGERGAEGVIPLTDSQQMALIGEAIGRYVTINFTNITKLNARQINKEMRKVSAESDFATNG